MEKFNIKSQKSLNGVKFEEMRDNVRKAFGNDYREMKKTPISKNTMDAYKEFHIFYTPDNRMEAIEIFPENRIIIDDEEMPMEYNDAKTWIKRLDTCATETNDGITSLSLGISLYAPDGKTESILVAKKQYFDW